LAWEKKDTQTWHRAAVAPAPTASSDETPTEDAEATGPERAPRSVRTDVIPRGAPVTEPSPDHERHRRRFRPATRRVKRVLRHIDPISVLKLSLIYNACFLVLWLLFVAVVYQILDAAGLFDAVTGFARDGAFLRKGEGLPISLWLVEKWALLLGLVLGGLASLVNVFLAFLYNLASDLVGGLKLSFIERDV
jgi:hypothetical protein